MERLSLLFQQYYDKTITPRDREELMRLMSVSSAETLEDLVQRAGVSLEEVENVLNSEQEERVLKNILPDYEARGPIVSHRVHFLRRKWVRYAAASIILVLGAGSYFGLQHKPVQSGTSMQKQESSINVGPGKEGAILTLADGRKVVLDSLGNGIVASQQGVAVVLENGQLRYDITGNGSGELAYNTISTPKGGQFQVILPDGTKVWLNAASSLTYPTQFAGKDRQVTVTGEGYFEVAPNPQQPFLVKIDDRAAVQVLGTSFNVNAYNDEPAIKTTLLEGSVKIIPSSNINNPTSNIILKPGQQSQFINDQSSIVNNANIGKAIAWRKGFFNFDNERLEEVARQLSRWYDIEVIYEKGIPDIQFFGELSREASLADIIKALKASKVNFRIEEGRKLIVTP